MKVIHRGLLAGLIAGLITLSSLVAAEVPRSPYVLSWSFPGDELSAIEIDRGDLSASRFASAIELTLYLRALPRQRPRKARPGEASVPARELRIDQRDAAGALRTSARYSLSLTEWRQRLGEPLVERLEDEFDAHLRMLLPRRHAPQPAAPRAPPDLGVAGPP